MAKLQKTLTFHDDLARLIQAYADKRGTTFQRVIQAAVLQFFFSETLGPDDSWLTAFVELEKGAGDPPVDLSTLPMRVWEAHAQGLERKLASYQRRHPDAGDDRYVTTMKQRIEWAYSEAGVWRSGISDFGGGIDGAIEFAIESFDEHNARFKREERMLAEADAEDDE